MQCDEIKSILLNRQTGIKLGSVVVLTGLISYLKFRPIAILVSSIYVTWIYRTFYSSYHIQIPKELTLKCKTIYENFKELREKKPNVFCGFITSMLFLLAVIGQVCNGTYILLACLIAGVFLTSKYEIKIIKENDASIESTPSSGVDVDEFCPQMDETNFMILKQIGDHADDSSIFSAPTNNSNNNNEIESDSDNELLPKNVIIPEPDEIDAIENEDLLIDTNLVLTQSAEYKRKHFSNTSSDTESDDSITRGLDFKNIPVTVTIEPHTSPSSSAHSMLMNIQQTIARNLIENVINLDNHKSSQTRVYDDDDSDFEILDSEDIPK
ncbi:uncharacterized protein [Chironomus tepperi]|uniref:uncharacterized protein n=1 Tax=Chironomus tepperi TaxID=113505 RepID=UPI00391F78B3